MALYDPISKLTHLSLLQTVLFMAENPPPHILSYYVQPSSSSSTLPGGAAASPEPPTTNTSRDLVLIAQCAPQPTGALDLSLRIDSSAAANARSSSSTGSPLILPALYVAPTYQPGVLQAAFRVPESYQPGDPISLQTRPQAADHQAHDPDVHSPLIDPKVLTMEPFNLGDQQHQQQQQHQQHQQQQQHPQQQQMSPSTQFQNMYSPVPTSQPQYYQHHSTAAAAAGQQPRLYYTPTNQPVYPVDPVYSPYHQHHPADADTAHLFNDPAYYPYYQQQQQQQHQQQQYQYDAAWPPAQYVPRPHDHDPPIPHVDEPPQRRHSQPALVRTTTLSQATHSRNLNRGSRSRGSAAAAALGPTVIDETTTAQLQIVEPADSILSSSSSSASPLDKVPLNWTKAERAAKRRLLRVQRRQKGRTVSIEICPVPADQYTQLTAAHGPDGPAATNSLFISCILWEALHQHFVTSVDCILLLEFILLPPPPPPQSSSSTAPSSPPKQPKFSIEEKNRIRRNLEGYHPLTISKANAHTAPFFKQIMEFPAPRPRNIEKDVKVFEWAVLGKALDKIVSKYSADYGSTA